MIKHWILNNFKSIEKEKNFEFRPLTIFAGANSSGKSTVLQSMLLVAQTIQNPIKSRSVVLNGHISKFGSYEDIVSNGETDRKIKIGFEIEPDDIMKKRKYYSPFGDDFKNLKCNFEISANTELEYLQPILRNVNIVTLDKKEKETKLSITRSNKKPEDRIKENKLNSSSIIDLTALEYEINNQFKARARYWMGNNSNVKYIGASLSHFLPEHLIGYYNKKEVFEKYLLNTLFTDTTYPYDEDQFKEFWTDSLKNSIKKIIAEIDVNDTKFPKKLQNQITQFNESFTMNVLKSIIKNGNAVELFKKNEAIFLAEIKKMSDSLQIESFPMYYSSEITFINEFFRNDIKYLGPLRDEPKSIYPLESFSSSTDVGFKGENTAAVLEYNKLQKIEYIPSKFYSDSNFKNLKPIKGTLYDAIHDWLIYLGIANDIQTNDKGKFGHELKISTDNKKLKQDLTHVGVGVSQVLPILVLSFLADKDSVLIFEQPELHLHPKVQTRLADFFVAMNALGKQCIIETHSEYLINRLRYLVAKSDDSKIANESIIYFVEKENGESIYRPININKYGVIEDWPKGFFDESEDIASQILRAGMEKRNSEKIKH